MYLLKELLQKYVLDVSDIYVTPVTKTFSCEYIMIYIETHFSNPNIHILYRSTINTHCCT